MSIVEIEIRESGGPTATILCDESRVDAIIDHELSYAPAGTAAFMGGIIVPRQCPAILWTKWTPRQVPCGMYLHHMGSHWAIDKDYRTISW